MLKVENIAHLLPRHPYKKYKIRTRHDISRLVVHCTGLHQVGDAFNMAGAVAKYHVGPNHISDTGCPAICYHYGVGTKGEVYQTLPVNECSWHAGVWNKGSLGVVLFFDPRDLGTERAGNAPESAQLNAAIRLCAAIGLQYNLSPDRVFGHRELQYTGWGWFGESKRLKKTCPGLGIDLDALRFDVAKKQQTTLLNLGLYNDKIDGIWGPNSRQAMSVLKKELAGAPLTKQIASAIRRKNVSR